MIQVEMMMRNVGKVNYHRKLMLIFFITSEKKMKFFNGIDIVQN